MLLSDLEARIGRKGQWSRGVMPGLGVSREYSEVSLRVFKGKS